MATTKVPSMKHSERRSSPPLALLQEVLGQGFEDMSEHDALFHPPLQEAAVAGLW